MMSCWYYKTHKNLSNLAFFSSHLIKILKPDIFQYKEKKNIFPNNQVRFPNVVVFLLCSSVVVVDFGFFFLSLSIVFQLEIV